MQIGDYVFVGEGTIVEAAAIGSYVRIGKNCVIVRLTSRSPAPLAPPPPPPPLIFVFAVGFCSQISPFSFSFFLFTQGKNTVLKDCCEIADDTVVPPSSVIPSFCLYGGVPSRLIDDLPECTQEHFETLAKERFANFVLK